MVEARATQLSHAQPLDIQGQHAALGLIDTADLFVVDRFSWRAHVAIDVKDHGHFAGEFLGHIEQRGDPHARHGLEAEFLNVVARTAGQGFQPLDFCWAVAPVGGLAAEDHAIEDRGPQAIRLGIPLGGRLDRRHGRHADFAVMLHFQQRQGCSKDRPLEHGFKGGRVCGAKRRHEEDEQYKDRRDGCARHERGSCRRTGKQVVGWAE